MEPTFEKASLSTTRDTLIEQSFFFFWKGIWDITHVHTENYTILLLIT